MGPSTAERLDGEYFTLELDCIAVKGKQEGVIIYTVFRNPAPEELAKWNHAKEIHDLMLEYYRKQQWDKAIALIGTIDNEFDGKMHHYYELWLERIQEMRNANLPTDWDGVFRATSK